MSSSRPYLLAVFLILAASLTAPAADPVGSEPAPPGEDTRRLVAMPAAAERLLRQDMVDHLVVLNQLLAHVAAAEFEQASELAESRLGKSSMGRHRGTGMGPGRFMPPEMNQLGMAMHRSASEFATVAASGDAAAATASLQRVTSYCVACHMSFRIR